MSVHTEKSFRNLFKSNWNQIVFTIFPLISNQTDVRLDLNQSENCKYHHISGLFSKISERFPFVQKQQIVIPHQPEKI